MMFWRQTHEESEVNEMLMFSGLEAQSEISLLLDELGSGFSGRVSRTERETSATLHGGVLGISKSEGKHEKRVTDRFVPESRQVRTGTL